MINEFPPDPSLNQRKNKGIRVTWGTLRTNLMKCENFHFWFLFLSPSHLQWIYIRGLGSSLIPGEQHIESEAVSTYKIPENKSK